MEMKIDKIQLQRVFDNILGNSIKHNEKVLIFMYL